MHRADRRGVDIRIKPSHPLTYLRRAPMWLVLLASHDQRLDLDRQLIGVPVRSPRAIGQAFQADVVVALEDLVAGVLRETLKSRHTAAIFSPSRSRAMNFSRLSIWLHSFRGILRSSAKGPNCVTHVSGMNCHPSLRKGKYLAAT